MRKEQLENFLILTETLNFRKASEKTYIAQPALSRQIQELEKEIGAELFDRSKKQIKLTPAGHFFKEEVPKILRQLNQSIKKTSLIHQGKAGEIKIGHSSSAMHSILPGLLRYFKTEVPELKASLIEGANQLIFDKLNGNEADFGFLPNPLVPEGLSSLTVYNENYVLILPKDHQLNKTNFSSLKDLAQENWILHPVAETGGYMEEIMRIFTRHGFYPKIVHRSPNTSTVLRLVEAGFGIAMMGKSTLKGYDALKIKSIELTDLSDQLNMELVWKTEREQELKPYLNLIKGHLKI